MLREKSRIVVVVALSIILLPFIVNAAQYSMADIVGTWENNGLASGPGAPWWIRGPITFSENGSWSAVFEEYPSEPQTNSGTFIISPDGTVSISWVDMAITKTMVCNMDLDKTVVACTASWSDSLPSTTQNAIMTKKGSSYTQTDLAGTWGVNATVSGPGAPWWEYGAITVAGDGSFSGTLQAYDGPDDVSGVFGISADGILTWPGDTADAHVRWTMDSGKTVAVDTSTWTSGNPGTSEMIVLTKKAPSYSQADVSGIWAYHSLVSGGPYAPGWYRGSVTIDSQGLATFTETDNTGGGKTFTKSLIISPDGSFTDVAPAGGGCSMDAGKTVIACVVTEKKGNGTVDMPIFVRTSSFTDVAPGHWAGNYIDALYRAGITTGYGGTAEFKPDYEITREQMAGFIVRTKTGEPPSDYCASGSPFTDVAPSSWSCIYIKKLYDLGLTTGYGGTSEYKPSLILTREQMATAVIRALEGEPASTYCDSGSPFTDVPITSWSCKYIKRLYERGITTGYGGTTEFKPALTVTRAQMATFIARAFLGVR